MRALAIDDQEASMMPPSHAAAGPAFRCEGVTRHFGGLAAVFQV